jgi:threonine/homoserine/homoserine lactone efflux protein
MYLNEFLAIALLHLLAVASPGPDFAVTTRYSLSYGGAIGRWVSVGIGVGILLHVAYSLLGVALVIHRYQWVYASVLVIGAIYLTWLGWQALQSQPRGSMVFNCAQAARLTSGQAFRVGFLTNGLNVKATLFFLALFSTVIDPATPNLIKLGYGVYMAVATTVWFSLLATLITWKPFYSKLWAISHWLDRIMGLALLLLSGRLFYEWFGLIGVIA